MMLPGDALLALRLRGGYGAVARAIGTVNCPTRQFLAQVTLVIAARAHATRHRYDCGIILLFIDLYC